MMRSVATTTALLVLFVGTCPGDPTPEDRTGLKVGEKATEFVLKDQAGKERSLKDLRKDGPVALVFYRSASW